MSADTVLDRATAADRQSGTRRSWNETLWTELPHVKAWLDGETPHGEPSGQTIVLRQAGSARWGLMQRIDGHQHEGLELSGAYGRVPRPLERNILANAYEALAQETSCVDLLPVILC